MRLIDADALKRQYEDHKRLFCRNRIEFSTLSDKDKARVDELDNCIADILNAQTIEERKAGKWKMTLEEDLLGFNTVCFRCSECNGLEFSATPFCRMCGTKMD